MHRFLKVPFGVRLLLAAFYRTIFLLSKKMIYRPKKPLKNQVIVVGSFLAGGAGKTPFALELSRRFLTMGFRVAYLCHNDAWDEYRMVSQKLPNLKIFKTRNRYGKAKEIEEDFDIVLCDGGLEDTRFSNAEIYVLRWGERAQKIADLLPAGLCVSLEKDHPNVKQIICMESETNMENSEMNLRFGISKIGNSQGNTIALHAKCAVVVGIGNPERFVRDVERYGLHVVRKIFLPDHFKNYAKVLENEILRGVPVVITEKDAARLDADAKKNPLLYIAEERVELSAALNAYLNAAAGGAARNPPSTL